MIDAPHIVQSAQQHTAVIHLTVPRTGIREAFGPACGELSAALAAQGVAPAGKLYSHHLRLPSETFDFEIGLPVAQDVAPTGRVRPGELPSLKVARTIYHGPMEGLGVAWGQLGDWARAKGHLPEPFLWEVYLVGADSGLDPSKWQTELNWPIADSVAPPNS
ncbi:MAG: transcriptional regulator, effector-binding domain/component [Betaproteobacteria bacterium]|nr:transcriptional regulator, effector-binding domain/component [Betaproteobacteria bacterium]